MLLLCVGSGRTGEEVDGDDENDEHGVEDDSVQIIAEEGGGQAVGKGVCGFEGLGLGVKWIGLDWGLINEKGIRK